MLAIFVMPILEYTRSILLQCVLQSPHPVVVKVHLQFLLRKWNYLPYTFYSLNWTQMIAQIINRNTVCLILQDSGLCSIFSITLIKHSKVMSNFGLFPPFLYTPYRKSYILALLTECLKYQPGWLFFYHWVIFKAILCCLSFPSSIKSSTLSLSQISIMGVLLLVILGETLNLFMHKILLLPRYIQSQLLKQDDNSSALSKCPCYLNPHNPSLVKKDYFIIPSPWAWQRPVTSDESST